MPHLVQDGWEGSNINPSGNVHEHEPQRLVLSRSRREVIASMTADLEIISPKLDKHKEKAMTHSRSTILIASATLARCKRCGTLG